MDKIFVLGYNEYDPLTGGRNPRLFGPFHDKKSAAKWLWTSVGLPFERGSPKDILEVHDPWIHPEIYDEIREKKDGAKPTDSEEFAKDYAKVLTGDLFEKTAPFYYMALKQVTRSILGYRKLLLERIEREKTVGDGK